MTEDVARWYDSGSYGDGLIITRQKADRSFVRLSEVEAIDYLNALEDDKRALAAELAVRTEQRDEWHRFFDREHLRFMAEDAARSQSDKRAEALEQRLRDAEAARSSCVHVWREVYRVGKEPWAASRWVSDNPTLGAEIQWCNNCGALWLSGELLIAALTHPEQAAEAGPAS